MISLLSSFSRKQQTRKKDLSSCCGCPCHKNRQHTRLISLIYKLRQGSRFISRKYFDDIHQPVTIDNSEEKKITTFLRLYEQALDEVQFATEFQGSIYYKHDLAEAQEAVNDCLVYFQSLVHNAFLEKSYQLHQKWSVALNDLSARLASLPQ